MTDSGVYAAQGGANWARAYELDTGRERWAFHSDGDNQAIVEVDGRVVVGFHGNRTAPRPGIQYQDVPSQQRPRRDKIFVLDARTGALDEWDASLRSTASPLGVWSLDATADALLVGGDFETVNGRTQQRIAIFPAE